MKNLPNNRLQYLVYAGDVLVTTIPVEFLDAAKQHYAESLGYRFEPDRRKELRHDNYHCIAEQTQKIKIA